MPRTDVRASERSEIAVAHVVGKNNDDVRRNGPLRRETREAGYNGSQHGSDRVRRALFEAQSYVLLNRHTSAPYLAIRFHPHRAHGTVDASNTRV